MVVPVELLIQTAINGLLLGGIYALVAAGFSLVWGVMNIINMTHGAFVMLGAYTAYWLFTYLGLDPFLGAVAAMIVMYPIGYAVQAGILNRIVRAPMFMTLALTFGLNLLIVNLASFAWTPDLRSVTTSYSGQGLSLGPLILPWARTGTLLVAVIATAGLAWFLSRTRMGLSIRATRMDLTGAEAVGVRIDRAYAVTFAVGAALAALAGGLISATLPITPEMGLAYTGKAFVITTIGGLGSISGALAGGLLLGVTEAIVATVLGSGFVDVVSFGLLVLMLLIRPRGLFGHSFFS
jgi:branched-chain amino acid transport system permease protein